MGEKNERWAEILGTQAKLKAKIAHYFLCPLDSASLIINNHVEKRFVKRNIIKNVKWKVY